MKTGGEKKEPRDQKRKRKEADKKAEEFTRKYVVPGLILFASVIVVFFFYRFGFGGSKQIPVEAATATE